MSSVPLWSCSSIRLRVALLILAALSIEGLMRSNLNMAMVCMLNSTLLASEQSSSLKNGSSQETSCEVLTIGSRPPVQYSGTLLWSSQERAVLYAMFYIGGLFATLTTEPLNRRFGSKTVVLWGAMVNVIGTFLTPPVASSFGPIPLFIVRFVMGFGQGVLYPCMSVLIAHWFPSVEKSTAIAITTTGNQISVIVALFMTAELCQLPWWDGWPFAFHLYGLVGVLFCVFWRWGVSDHPTNNPYITEAEKHYIVEGKHHHKQPKARWGVLLRSPLVWSLAACSFCHNFVTVGTVTYLPLYYRTVLNMSLTSNGVFSALPFVGQFVSKVLFAAFADECKKRKWMSVNAVTKLCNLAASLGIGLCFLAMCFLDCSQRPLAVAAVFGAMVFVSGYVPGYNTSVVCIAPSQTAAIASFTRFWAQVGSSIAPYMIGALARTGALSEWRLVFGTIFILCVATGLFFQICGSASIQEWNTVRVPDVPLVKEPLSMAVDALDEEEKSPEEKSNQSTSYRDESASDEYRRALCREIE